MFHHPPHSHRAFTLIELMIVVTIIAVVAAMALPSMVRARMASNETSAIGTLRNIIGTEATLRSNDSDRNALSDWWTADFSGLYRIESLKTPGEGIALVDIAQGMADEDKIAAGAATASAGGFANLVALPKLASKSGYFFSAMVTDQAGAPYEQDPDADGQTWTNTATFGFQARPEAYDSSGVHTFIANETGVTYARDFGNSAVLNATVWPGSNPSVLGWRVVQ